jgi:hypothetical protein
MASNFVGNEFRPTPPNNKGNELPPNLNLMQLVEPEELVGRRTHPRLEFECITKLWHQRLGANAHSLCWCLKLNLL